MDISRKFIELIPADPKYLYLVFFSEFRQTGIIAYRKNHYTMNNLKLDVRRNMEILFNMNHTEFEDIWTNFINIFDLLNEDLFETLAYKRISERLMAKYHKEIQQFLGNNIRKLSDKNINNLSLYLEQFYGTPIYLFDSDKFGRLYKLIFGELSETSIQQILMRTGIALETEWISSKGNDLGLYFDVINFPNNIIKNLENPSLSHIKFPSFKKSYKSFLKRFDYTKNRDNFSEYVGVDLLLSGYEHIEEPFKIIVSNDTSSLLSHPNIIGRNIYNPNLKEQLWNFVLKGANYLLKNYIWVNEIFDRLSNFSFLEESTDFYSIFNHVINNIEYHVIISSWYRYSIPIEEKSILILLYHSNIESIITNLIVTESLVCCIAFNKVNEIYIIGSQNEQDLIDLIENEFKKTRYLVKKKIVSEEKFRHEGESIFYEYEPDLLRKIFDLLEKHDNDVNAKLDQLRLQLEEKLGSDYQKLKLFHQQYKKKEIKRRKYLAEVGKIIGKHSLTILNLFF